MSVQIEEVALHAADEWFDGAQNRSDIRADVGSYYEGYLAAVLAERRRVWDIINEQVQYEIQRERSNGPYRLQAEVIKKLIFPNGEPKTEYPQT